MRKGYHSIQGKFLGTIPRSEFYGFALGYGFGTVLRGVFSLPSDTIVPIVLAAVGLAVGIWVDRKYYTVKDEPDGESPAENTGDRDTVEDAIRDAGDAQEDDENLSTQQRLRRMFQKNMDGDSTDDEAEEVAPEAGEPEGETDIPDKA